MRTYLVVGLGNPGREYAQTRHNAGFMLADALAARLGVRFRRLQFKALTTDARYGKAKIILAKPQTYMNLSGQAVAPLLRFYKIPPERLLVAYDDLDLPLGTVRLRPKGGHGGHKGMRSIIERLGTQEFPRLRLGIGRPPGRMDAAAYVLQPFSPAEKDLMSLAIARGVEGIFRWWEEDLSAAMNLVNAPEEG